MLIEELVGVPEAEVAKGHPKGNGPRKLTHAKALRRCIRHLYAIWEPMLNEFGNKHPYVMQMAYTIDFAETRLPEAEATAPEPVAAQISEAPSIEASDDGV
jgi:hypothetical protein